MKIYAWMQMGYERREVTFNISEAEFESGGSPWCDLTD